LERQGNRPNQDHHSQKSLTNLRGSTDRKDSGRTNQSKMNSGSNKTNRNTRNWKG